MENWLLRTAWPMRPPLPYSEFHLLFVLAGTAAAAGLAWLLHRLPKRRRIWLLFTCGVLLALSEGYKQLFLYYIVNHGTYDWWYFPFQLCSLPMYLCLLLPFCQKAGRRILCTFMLSYNLLGAFMAFVEPSGLMHPYWTLTLHSFLWHIMLIFIGLLIAFSGMAKPGGRAFAESTALFFACCLVATVINVGSHPYGYADMFYITPYYPTTQMVYAQIAAAIGIIPGNLVYIASIVAGAGMIHSVYSRLN